MTSNSSKDTKTVRLTVRFLFIVLTSVDGEIIFSYWWQLIKGEDDIVVSDLRCGDDSVSDVVISSFDFGNCTMESIFHRNQCAVLFSFFADFEPIFEDKFFNFFHQILHLGYH